MPTYDEIMKGKRPLPSLQGQKVRPEALAGIKIAVNCVCPECDHKFVVIVVVQHVGILLLSPNYDKKGRVVLERTMKG